MPTPPLSREAAQEAIDALREHGSKANAARALGLPRGTFANRIRHAEAMGLHMSEGARDAVQSAGLNGIEAKGGWIHNYDGEGKKIGTTRWNAPDVGTETLIDKIRDAFHDIPAAPAIIAPRHVKDDTLAFLPHGDWHLGLKVTAEEVGRDYDRKIAVERLQDGMSRCLAATPPSKRAIIVNNGDATHANDNTDQTPRSKHSMKVEGTHYQNIGIAIAAHASLIDMALQRHETVEYRANGGNHDPDTPAPITWALTERYRNNPRVKIHAKEGLWWQENFGEVFLSAHHGHTRKPAELAKALPGFFREAWSETRHWFLFTSHRHTYVSETLGHVQHRQLPAVCSADPYAYDGGFGSIPGMRAFVFHREDGLRDELTVNL